MLGAQGDQSENIDPPGSFAQWPDPPDMRLSLLAFGSWTAGLIL